MELFFEELREFVGRTHPIFVHLPIGMLVVAFFMALFGRREALQPLRPAIPFVLLLGSIAAVLAALTGFLLSRRGGYDVQTLDFHQWLGIAVAAVSILLYSLYRNGAKDGGLKRYRFGVFSILMVLVGLTGHFGGTLTHGAGYFTDALPSGVKNFLGYKAADIELAPIENVQEALVYEAIVAPILQQRCQSCHGERKKEGGLALHTREAILQGGDGGQVLLAGKMVESELYARLVLPEGHEGRMPPKGRTPITGDQIKLIGWWIAQGASFSGKVNALQQSAEIKQVLTNLEKGSSDGAISEFASLPEAPALPEDLVNKLQSKGIKVLPIDATNNYVAINAINYPEFSAADMADLLPLKAHIVQLKLGRTAIKDEDLTSVAMMPHLRKLHLEHTQISDVGLKHLEKCTALSYVNLFGTAVSDVGLAHLAQVKPLKTVYAYQTKVTAEGIAALRKKKITTLVDSGKYQLPALASDTTHF